MFVVDMAVHLSDYSFNEVWGIWLVQSLVQVHNVAHHLCVESYKVRHAVLKGQMFIMEKVLGGLSIVVAASLEGRLVDLAVAFDNVNHDVAQVDELGDVQGSLVPSHDEASIFEGLDKGHGHGGGHREPLVLGKLLAAFLVDRLTQLS
jgi:hypothetical protein